LSGIKAQSKNTLALAPFADVPQCLSAPGCACCEKSLIFILCWCCVSSMNVYQKKGVTAAGLRQIPLLQERFSVLVGFGFIWGYLYGVIMNVWFWTYFVYPLTLKTYLLTEINALVWDGTRALANALFLGFFGAKVIRVLEQKRRTYYREIRLGAYDLVTVCTGLFPYLFGLYLRSAGYGGYRYYPSLQKIDPGQTGWFFLAALAATLLLILPLTWWRRRYVLD